MGTEGGIILEPDQFERPLELLGVGDGLLARAELGQLGLGEGDQDVVEDEQLQLAAAHRRRGHLALTQKPSVRGQQSLLHARPQAAQPAD